MCQLNLTSKMALCRRLLLDIYGMLSFLQKLYEAYSNCQNHLTTSRKVTHYIIMYNVQQVYFVFVHKKLCTNTNYGSLLILSPPDSDYSPTLLFANRPWVATDVMTLMV